MRRTQRLFAVVLMLLVGIQISPALSVAAPSWNPQAHETNPPSDADPEFPFAHLRSVSCRAPGSCSAVGSYYDSESQDQAMVVTRAGGAWEPAEKVSLPLGNEDPYLPSISCSSAGNCTAVGQINIGSESGGLVVSQIDGVWGVAQVIPGPPGAEWTWLSSVSCPADGACTAVGGYYEDSSREQAHAMVVSESAGVWGVATAIQLPTGVSPSAEAFLNDVSCAAAGSCTALGSFSESPSDYQTMVASQSAGAWGSAEELTEPTSSSFFVASGISCGAVGFCAVGGSYKEEGGINRPAVADQTEGLWGPVAPLSLPADVSSTNSHSEVESIACVGEDSCTAVGNYEDNTKADRAFSAKKIGGAWTLAEQLSVPGISEPESQYHVVGVKNVDCVTAESCGATGFAYFRGVTFLMEGGSWGAGGSSIMLPPDSQSEEAGALESLSCGGPGSCSAVGTYVDGEGMSRAMALDTEGAPLAQHVLEVTKAGSGSGAVTSEPAGIDCGSACEHSFGEGTAVTLTATPTGDSTFAGWSGACSGTGPCKVAMGGDRAVTASFLLRGGGEEEHHVSPPPEATVPPPPAEVPVIHPKKVLKCRKGFVKRRIHGKPKCVRTKRKHQH